MPLFWEVHKPVIHRVRNIKQSYLLEQHGIANWVMGLGKVQGQDDNVRVNGLRQSVGVASRTVPETGKTIIIEFMWFVMTCKRQVIRLLPSPASAIQYTGRRQVAGDTVYLQQQARVRRHSSVLTAEQRANAVYADVTYGVPLFIGKPRITLLLSQTYRTGTCAALRVAAWTVLLPELR